MLRLPRWRANVGPLWFRPDEPALAADEDLRRMFGSGQRDEQPLATAVAASAVVHALLALVAALAIGGGGSELNTHSPAALHATLATPPQRFTVPEQPAPPYPAASAGAPASPLPEAVLPLPIPVAPPMKAGTGGGGVIVHVAEPDESLEPAVLAALQRTHPGAVRIVPEFEVEPSAAYPQSALAGRRQSIVSVLVVVHEDGRLEPAPGTLDDPVFGASIRDALAVAKARPPQVNGKAVTGWSLLRFYYEFVGANAVPPPTR